MNGWSAAATSRPSRSLSSSPDRTITQTRRSPRRCPSSKRPEPPTSSPTNEAPPSYTTSWDLTEAEGSDDVGLTTAPNDEQQRRSRRLLSMKAALSSDRLEIELTAPLDEYEQRQARDGGEMPAAPLIS